METFNRKLNMIKITGLIILLFLVKHDNATDPPSTTNSTTVTNTAQSPTMSPTTSTIAPSSNGTTTLSQTVSSLSPSSNNTPRTKVTTTTTIPTTTKAPDKCYVFSCTNATCIVNENKTVNFPSTVQNCTRANAGYCYINKTVNANNVTFTMGCNTKCQNKADIAGCCDSNLCNGDLSLLLKSKGQFVNYNFLLTVLCIAISLF